MEAIFGLIVTIAILVGFNFVLNAGIQTAKAGFRAATGKGSFADNMELAFQGMKSLEARFNDSTLNENGEGPLVKQIEVKGLFPVQAGRRVGFVTSVLDETSGELEPVVSAIDTFQEEKSVAYQHSTEVGDVNAGQGFISWVRVGVVIPKVLTTPYGGKRALLAILRMIDLDDPPTISHGYHQPDTRGILWQTHLKFEFEVEGKGYQEAAEHRDEANALAVKIGVAVAMSDGSLADKEGETLRRWIIKAISPFNDEKRQHLKEIFNNAFVSAHTAAKEGTLSLSALTQRLNEIGEKSTKYEVVELCFDVMAADGVADSGELKTIHRIAEALGLDINEIEKMRDKTIIALGASVSNQSTIEDLLGIELNWDKDRIKKHLRSEFQKWNNRLNTLDESGERENAQRMLNLIAEAHKKYG